MAYVVPVKSAEVNVKVRKVSIIAIFTRIVISYMMVMVVSIVKNAMKNAVSLNKGTDLFYIRKDIKLPKQVFCELFS